jgi:two-component system, OmpR family, sensor histidine kinase VicK
MRPHLSLRTKLFFSILLILLVSYSFLLFTTINSFESFLAREVSKDLDASLNLARNQYFARADQIKLALMQPARAPNVQREFRSGNRLWFRDAMRRWRASIPFIDILTIVDARNKVLARLGSYGTGDTYLLTDVVKKASREKAPVVSTELVSSLFLCREGRNYYCKPLPDDQQVMMITIAVPVVTESGALLGTIVAGDIVNKDPYYPYQVQKIFGKDVELTITQKDRKIASSIKSAADFPSTLDSSIVSALEREGHYRGETTIGNRAYKTAFEPISDSSGRMVGSLSVALSKDNFRRIRRDNELNMLSAASVGIFLTFVIAFFATRQITRPLKALSQGVRSIEEGDLDQRVVVPSGDEFGMLADSFNRMASALVERDGTIKRKNTMLQELNELLERKVSDRTAELRMEMERLETVLTSMVEGLVVTDRDNRVILFNPAAQKLFDLVPHRVIHQPVDKVCELGGISVLAGYVDKIRSDGTAVAGREEELEVKGKKLKVYLSPLMDEAETFAGVVMSIRDVTVEEEVGRMKTEFISTVSHELKTPLTSMKGSLQFIMGKGKWLTVTERELLAVCLRNTERLIRLINDILDISKIEAGKIDFELKPQSIGNLVAYALDEIRSFAMSRSITVINEIGDDLPRIYGDHDRLVQVLTNLLSNAVKFSPEGQAVAVSAVQEGNYIAVSVVDQGKVIQWSDREKLFNKFQQLDRSETGERGGTGLGLAICKELVEKHHGRIYYQAGVTGGNIFTFKIPVYEEHDEN